MMDRELLIRIDERQKDILSRMESLEVTVSGIDSYVQKWKWAASVLMGISAFGGWLVSFVYPLIKQG